MRKAASRALEKKQSNDEEVKINLQKLDSVETAVHEALASLESLKDCLEKV